MEQLIVAEMEVGLSSSGGLESEEREKE